MAITVFDNFDDGVIDLNVWTNSVGPIAEESGVALIPSRSGVGCRFATANTYNLTGDSVTVRVPTFPLSTTAQCHMAVGLLPVGDANEFSNWAGFQKQGTVLTFESTAGFTGSNTTLTFDATNHRWWRIRESAGSLFWDTAPDDATGLAPGSFTQRRTLANPWAVTALRMELRCQDNTAAVTGECMEVSHFRTTGYLPRQNKVLVPSRWRMAIGGTATRADVIAHAPEYDMLVMNAGSWEWRDRVKEVNPSCKCLVYKDAAGMINAPGTGRDGRTVYSTGVSLTAGQAAGTTYFLHSTAAGGIASDPTSRIQFADYPGVFAANIGLAAYQNAWATNVISDLADGKWDGVFMDDLNPTMGTHWPTGIADVAEYPSDATYGAAFDSFIANVGPKIKAASYMILANFGPFWTETDTTKNDRLNGWVASYLDLGMDEFWVKWRDTTFHTALQKVFEMANMRTVLSRGGDIAILIPGQAGDVSSPRAVHAMACALLAGRESRRVYSAWDRTNGGYGGWDVFAEQVLALGYPLMPYRRTSTGLWWRTFSGGEVWVNSTGGTLTATFVKPHYTGATSASILDNGSFLVQYDTPTVPVGISTGWTVG